MRFWSNFSKRNKGNPHRLPTQLVASYNAFLGNSQTLQFRNTNAIAVEFSRTAVFIPVCFDFLVWVLRGNCFTRDEMPGILVLGLKVILISRNTLVKSSSQHLRYSQLSKGR